MSKKFFWVGPGTFGKEGIEYGKQMPDDVDAATLDSLIASGKVVDQMAPVRSVDVLGASQAELEGAKRYITDLEAQLTDTQAQINAANTQLTDAQAQLANAIAAPATTTLPSELQAELDSLKAQLTDAQATITALSTPAAGPAPAVKGGKSK